MKFLTLILLLFSLTTLAQPLICTEQQMDSIRNVLKTSIHDTIRVKSLYLLSRYITLKDTKEAIELSEQGIALARKIQYPEGEMLCLEASIFPYSLTGAWEKSLKRVYEARALNRLYAPEHEIYTINMLTLLYQRLNDDETALKLAIENYHHYNFYKSDLLLGQWATLMMLGQEYKNLNVLDSAEFYSLKSVSLAEKKAPSQLGHSYTNLSDIEFKRKNYNKALDWAYKSMQVFQNAGFIFSIHETQDRLAQIYWETNQLDSVKKYAELALEGSLKMNNYIVIKNASKLLTKIYEKKNPLKAFEMLKLTQMSSDTINNLEKIKQVSLLQIKEKERIENLLLTEKENKRKLLLNTIVGLLASVSVIALILFYNNRQKQKAKIEIEKAYSDLAKTHETLKTTQAQLVQKEKMASLGELTAGIAHEIQNPLNFVNNFSELSVDLAKELNEEIDKDEIDKDLVKELVSDLTSNQEKINHHGKRASNIVKGMLEHSRSSTGIKEPTDINKLVDESLRLSYHATRAKDKSFNADFTMELDETIGKIDIIPQDMGRVFLNLFNNAFYAVHQRHLQEPNHTPSLSVSSKQLKDSIEIRVKDNGVGIPENIKQKIFQPFFTTKPTGQGTGLGLSLSYDIVVKGHGGSLEVLSVDEGNPNSLGKGIGSEFIIQLPKTL